jgi:hypothetical protein
MRTRIRLTLPAVLAAAALPMAGSAALAHGEPACDDPVAETIHELEEATHLHQLHEVEEAYCEL